jgi:acetolactate synthase I/II/III large subunit
MDERTPANMRTPAATRKRGKAAAQAGASQRGGQKKNGGGRVEPKSWTEVAADERGDAIVAAMALGGVDHLFFNSGSEIMFMQEAIAKAHALGQPAPKLIAMTHEYPTLNAALGYAAVTGKPAATSVHVDVGTQHYGCAIHTARHANLPILVTAGAPPVAYPGSMRGARDGSHFGCSRRSIRPGSCAST